MLHLGYKPEEVAEMQAISIPTVYSMIKHWRRGSIEKPVTKLRSGRSAKADEAYKRLVTKVVEKEPEEFGYNFRVWTFDRLRLHRTKETGIEMSEPLIHTLLKAKGYRYRRPKMWDICRIKNPKSRWMN